VVSWYNTTREKVTDPRCFPVAEIQESVRQFLPVQVTQSGPDSQWAGIRQMYFHMIMAANSHIYMQSPFFIPDQSISEALKAAALSGVDVRLMVQPRGGSYQIPYRAAYTYFEELAEAGARIYLYENDTYFHAKTLNIDSAICTVGTANMDIRSFSINYEINAVLYDEEKAQELAQDFLDDLQHCREFDLAEYRAGSALGRLRDSVYRLASPLL
jgi:cardiolipin synthase